MISLNSSGFLTCEALTQAGFPHAFGTRRLAANDPGRFLSEMKAADRELILAKQIHSDTRLIIEEKPVLEGDALITGNNKILVGVKTADCVPLLSADPKTGLRAAVHAGWRGTLQRIAQKAIADMKINPADCIAALGPSACGDCYEVGPEVVEQFKNEFPEWPKFLKRFSPEGKAFFDGQQANREQLLEAGLKPENIHVASYCTMHQNDLFFSHRREKEKAGRMLSVI